MSRFLLTASKLSNRFLHPVLYLLVVLHIMICIECCTNTVFLHVLHYGRMAGWLWCILEVKAKNQSINQSINQSTDPVTTKLSGHQCTTERPCEQQLFSKLVSWLLECMLTKKKARLLQQKLWIITCLYIRNDTT